MPALMLTPQPSRQWPHPLDPDLDAPNSDFSQRDTMLNHIPSVISPDLLAVMMRMGHGDTIVFADAHFPADSHAQRIVRADGIAAPLLLDAVLRLLPVDDFVPDPINVMQPVDPQNPEPPIWSDYRAVVRRSTGRAIPLTPVDRFAFYDLARRAYAIVATGETAIYANILIKKGIATLTD